MSSLTRRLRRLRPLATDDRVFLDEAYRDLLGRPVDADGRRHHGDALRAGADHLEVVTRIATSDEYVGRVTREASTDPVSGAERDDDAFLRAAYELLLDRPPDDAGRRSFLASLRDGASRSLVVGTLAGSDEHLNRVGRRYRSIQSLRELRPDAYTEAVTDSGTRRAVFTANAPPDFDWLENAILEHGYYEQPGVWSYSIDLDKRVMAEVMSSFAPDLTLDLGCASGAVMACMRDLGHTAEGVEISRLAIDRAEPDVAERIHQGDLLALDLGERYDLVFGLDIFEHLNPNRIDAYLRAIADCLVPGGFVFANIPVFGDDPGFGTVSPVDLEEWRHDLDGEGSLFSALPVDADGYPQMGHLIWADSPWWVRRFDAVGLGRELGIERALHRRYDEFLASTYPGRRMFYVFSKGADGATTADIVERIDTTPSAVLSSLGDAS